MGPLPLSLADKVENPRVNLAIESDKDENIVVDLDVLKDFRASSH